jgi:hypothetical protein
MNFFSSDIGVAIAWICSVLGFLFGFVKMNENSKLKIEINGIKQANNVLTNKIESLKAGIVDQSNNEVTQSGEKNIYNKQVTGGMNVKM